MENELLDILMSLSAQNQVLQETVLQLIEQLVRPDGDASGRFADAMRARLNQVLVERADDPHAPSEAQMTLVLAAVLAAAGCTPMR